MFIVSSVRSISNIELYIWAVLDPSWFRQKLTQIKTIELEKFNLIHSCEGQTVQKKTDVPVDNHDNRLTTNI